MTDVESAKFNPSRFFNSPADVLADKSLSKADKIAILQCWAIDERERLVAEEENMLPNDQEIDYKLAEIHQALESLGVYHSDSSATKHG